ncbi:MAG: 4Fe-4S binding protein, partial [Bacteroidales bacterium]|nr:4Fe-4S binding protein [Bacteroidales bacterium]
MLYPLWEQNAFPLFFLFISLLRYNVITLFFKKPVELGLQLADLEGQAHHLVILGHGALRELGAQVAGELAVVEFADHDLLVLAQDVAGVLRQRADIVEVGVGHLLAFVVHLLDGEGQGTCCAAPTHHEQVGVLGAGDLLVGDVVGYAVHLLLAVLGHEGVVLGVGAERTVGAFLQTADAVAQAGHAGQGPLAGEFLLVAAEGTVVGVVLLGQTSPNPVLSTLDNFWDEYVEPVVDKKCRAGICKKLMQYVIDPEKCIGCGKCAKNCPAETITRT